MILPEARYYRWTACKVPGKAIALAMAQKGRPKPATVPAVQCTWAVREILVTWGVTRDEARILETGGVVGEKEVPVFLAADAL